MKDSRGFILVATISVLSLVMLSMFVALTFTQVSGKVLHRQLTYQGQALNVAGAGLVEGQDWFRRQTGVVATFAPFNDPSLDPARNDTDEEVTPPAIIRNFEISSMGRVWGRYEVRQGTSAGVVDLSDNRGKGTAGVLWQIESTGMIFVRNNPSVAYDVAPNVVLARRTVRNEIQKLTARSPAAAAICIPTPSRVLVGTAGAPRAKVLGQQAAGIAYSSAGAVPAPATASPGAVLGGTPPSQGSVPIANFTENYCFGVSRRELTDLADIRETTVAALPDPLPQMQLIVMDLAGTGTVTFDASTRPLRGSGILYVNGNLTIGSTSSWNGLIYVTGDYTQVGPAAVSGSIVVSSAGSDVTISGTSDYALTLYDKFMLDQATAQIGQYRVLRPLYVP